MRIGITCYPTVGGSGTVANMLGLHLARRDHEVHFIAQRLLMRPDEFHENVRFHEVDRTSLGLFDDPPNDLALAAKMADVVRENRLELLHVRVSRGVVHLGARRHDVGRVAALRDDVVDARLLRDVLAHHVHHVVHRLHAVERRAPLLGGRRGV